jgi:hypothetical protein
VSRVVELSTFLGAAVLFWTAYCLAVPRRRVQGVVLGSLGMLAGALAAFSYTLFHFRRGLDIDSIPHEPAAQWFVAAFGWIGLLAIVAMALVPSVRAYVKRRPLAP